MRGRDSDLGKEATFTIVGEGSSIAAVRHGFAAWIGTKTEILFLYSALQNFTCRWFSSIVHFELH